MLCVEFVLKNGIDFDENCIGAFEFPLLDELVLPTEHHVDELFDSGAVAFLS